MADEEQTTTWQTSPFDAIRHVDEQLGAHYRQVARSSGSQVGYPQKWQMLEEKK